MDASSSFEKIDYRLRIGKSIERKMLNHSFHRLKSFDQLYNYTYIGFGSTTFEDFKLFHRDLGIIEMISIEKEEDKSARFDFNKPYSNIEIRFGESNDLLPLCSWEKRTILWLDYDKIIQSEYFFDLGTFFSKAQSGSVFLMTLNVSGSAYVRDGDNEQKKEKIIKIIGQEKLPIDLKDIDFSNNNLAKSIKKIFEQEIFDVLNSRNLSLSVEQKINYQPLYNFVYQDGAKMLTFGGIIYSNMDSEKYINSDFGSLEFVRMNDEECSLLPPPLTIKEINLLNTQLPNLIDNEGKFIDKDIVNPSIPDNHIKEFKSIYKFFPVFAESFIS